MTKLYAKMPVLVWRACRPGGMRIANRACTLHERVLVFGARVLGAMVRTEVQVCFWRMPGFADGEGVSAWLLGVLCVCPKRAAHGLTSREAG